MLKKPIGQGERTLIFIDEIQNSPEAVAMLRYFYEEASQLYVVAARSLLETLIDTHINFPVGRVEYMAVRPCSFREFLMATGEEQSIKLLDTIPFPAFGHDILMKQFKRYALIGGMPEIVQWYSKGKSIENRM